MPLNFLKKVNELISNPVVPKSDDQASIDWLANWLNNRRGQLYENMVKSPKYAFKVGQSLGDLVKGYQAGRVNTNKEYYRQLRDAASPVSMSAYEFENYLNKEYGSYDKTPEQLRSLSTMLSIGNIGGSYLPNLNIIVTSPDKDKGTDIHERVHAANPDALIEKVGNMKTEENLKIIPYWDDPNEVYSRLMEFRFINKIDPKKIYDKNSVKQLRKSSKDNDLFNRYSDDQMLYLLNDVASNNKTTKLYFTNNIT